ncbi:MAG: hypothetical protein Q9187_004805 [Circinaria calcarea]
MADRPYRAFVENFHEETQTTIPDTRLADDAVPGDSTSETARPNRHELDGLRSSGDLSGTRESSLAADPAEAVSVAADESAKLQEDRKELERQKSEALPISTLPVRRGTSTSVYTDPESDSAPAGGESIPEVESQHGSSPTSNERHDTPNQLRSTPRNEDPSTHLVYSHTAPPENRNKSTAFGAQSVVVDFLNSRGESPEPFIGRFPVYKILGGMDRDFSSEESKTGPSMLMHEAKLFQGKSLAEPSFRWIHLPSNNMDWFEMPYLHWERQSDQSKRRRIIGEIDLVPRPWFSLPERAMYTYLQSPSPLHIRRTLDQYFHLSLKDTHTRDDDQVVNRYVRDILRYPDPPIMMVDQLWLCILDDGLIVTAFPTSFGQEDDPDGHDEVLEHILGHLAKGVVSTLESSWDLAALIIDHASGFFFKSSQLPTPLRFIEFFANSISAVSDKTTTCFTRFNNLVAQMENLRASTDPTSLMELNRALDSHSNISSETFLIREIQDIMDELNSILKVYKEQGVVARLLKNEYHKIVNLAKKQGWKNTAAHLQEQRTSAAGLTVRNVSNGSKHLDARIEAWAEIDPLRAIEERKLEFGGLILQAERTYDAVRYSGALSAERSLLIVFLLTRFSSDIFSTYGKSKQT